MNNTKFKILDCTLRDGGYYTNWDFDPNLVETYFTSLNSLPIEFLEIGYRSNPMKAYLGEFFYCPEYLLKKCKGLTEKKLVIILNEKDVRAEHVPNLLQPCVGYIDMVRIAIDPKNFTRALILADAVKRLGFQVGFNVMYMSNWENEKEFLAQIKEVDGVADYFYMVDSFGGVYPEDVKKTYDIIRNQSQVKIGFHGHNNLELGLINTLTAIDCGADIVDATITGMGRGAGNLKTELLLTALNSKENLAVDFNALSEITGLFSDMQKEYEWGTNLPYMVSGANSLPQKQVMEWVSKRFYSFNSIIRALHNQRTGQRDNESFSIFEPNKKYAEVIIVGGGPTVHSHIDGIEQYLRNKNNEEICVIHASSRNAKPFNSFDVDQYFCLIGNEGLRIEKVFQDFEQFRSICLLPPFPRKMGTYIPDKIKSNTFQLDSFSINDLPQESPTVLAIELAKKLGAETVAFVGYDGYSDTSIGQKEQELFLENDLIFKNYCDKGLNLYSLTPSKYPNLPVESIYSKL